MGEAIDEQFIAKSANLEIKKAGAAIPSSFLSFVFLNKADDQERIKTGQRRAGELKLYEKQK